MSTPLSPREVFLALVNGICEGKLDEVVDLYAEKTDVSHPFDPLCGHGLASRAELAQHFARRPSRRTIKVHPANIKVHETLDPEVIVAEFDHAGENLDTGSPFAYRCVFIMRVRNGEIVESRDYIDHLGSAEARGLLAPLLAEITARRIGKADSPPAA
jgi:ketosteroid isomerase-like protein